MPQEIEKEIENKARLIISRSDGTLGSALGIEFQVIRRNELIATMPVNENTIQPFGILHGGASVALAETLASVGAYLNLDDDRRQAVGVEINANHIRSVPKGKKVKGIAQPVRIGRKTQVWEIRIYDEREKLVCISRCTLMVI